MRDASSDVARAVYAMMHGGLCYAIRVYVVMHVCLCDDAEGVYAMMQRGSML